MLKHLALVGVLFLFFDVSKSATLKSGQPSKPHIIFMMVDDWGWANVGYHLNTTSKEVVTPNIDNLVKEGVQLDQHYVFNWCSPTRSAFLTGRVPIHVNDVTTSETAYNSKDPVSGFDGYTKEYDRNWYKNERRWLCNSPGGEMGCWNGYT